MAQDPRLHRDTRPHIPGPFPDARDSGAGHIGLRADLVHVVQDFTKGPELTPRLTGRSKALTAQPLLRSAAPFSLLHSLRFNRYAESLPPLSWRGIPEE